jgi:hypothetical protein
MAFLEITSATYGGADCTEILKSKIKGDTLILRVDNSIMGDTLVGQVKFLQIEGKCGETEFNERVREGDVFRMPKSTNKKLGIWYSNDQTGHPCIKKSLESIQIASQNKADIITCVWNRIENNPFHEIISWNRSSSHLNQLLQILQCIFTAKTMGNYDYVSFLEHDVMYGEGYFDFPEFERGEIWTNMNYGGINRTGWQNRKQNDEPMHQMTMRIEDALEHFLGILDNALVTNSGMIEDQVLIRKQWYAENQSIHINHGSHFTSHFTIYDTEDTYKEHMYWANHNDYLYLFNG